MFNEEDREYLNNPDYNMPLEKYFESKYYNELDFSLRNDKNSPNGTINKAYPFSNEQLDSIFQYIKLKHLPQRAFCVGSSGDQLLNSIYKGVKEITFVDGNIFSKYHIDYKIAAIKNLNFKDFYHYFIETNDRFCKDVYQKIFHDLDKDSQTFWGTIFIEENDPEIIYNNICRSNDIKTYNIHSLFYEYPKAYKKLQTILRTNEYTINYENYEFSEFWKAANGKYDIILLSNIFTYVKSQHFSDLIDILYKDHLNEQGFLQLDYSFNKYYKLKDYKTAKEALTELLQQHNIHCLPLSNAQESYFLIKPEIKKQRKELMHTKQP